MRKYFRSYLGILEQNWKKQNKRHVFLLCLGLFFSQSKMDRTFHFILVIPSQNMPLEDLWSNVTLTCSKPIIDI